MIVDKEIKVEGQTNGPQAKEKTKGNDIRIKRTINKQNDSF